MNIGITKTIEIGGKQISIETGKLAKQADGAVVLRMGDTMILATVVANKGAKEGVDFLPLTVDYREKFAADGRIPGSFFRREARPSEREILVMRIVDRALRPLFPDDFHAEVQLMMQLIAYDGVNSPDALVGFAASSCIAISDIPFNGPMSEVRVGRVDGEFVINPTLEEMKAPVLVRTGSGSKRIRFALFLVRNGSGSHLFWFALVLVRNGSGSHLDLYRYDVFKPYTLMRHERLSTSMYTDTMCSNHTHSCDTSDSRPRCI